MSDKLRRRKQSKSLAAQVGGQSELSEAAKIEEARLQDYFREKNLREIDHGRFLTNDIVHMEGGFGTDPKSIKINGIRISLTRPEFIFLFILIAHAQTRAGLPSLRRVEGGEFLSVERLFEEIKKLSHEHPVLSQFWDEATFSTVHGMVCDLREKIVNAGGNGKLIETGPAGEGGYRLSVVAHHLSVTLL